MLFDLTNPIAEWIFPRRCILCNRDVARENLCPGCESLCNKIASAGVDEKKPALFFNELSIKALIKKAKYYGELNHAAALMTMVARQLTSCGVMDDLARFSPTVITAVPSHWFNRMTRGIEIPQLFAGHLARRLNVAVRPCLRRANYRNRQVLRASKTERLRGITGAFLLRSKRTRFDRILLVDDIVTTGATFDESKKVLRTIAGDVKCLAIARTP